MSQNLAEIVRPLVERGQFENAESAIRNLTAEYMLRQINRYRKTVRKFEKKYAMHYEQFSEYLKQRAKKVAIDSSLHKKFMTEEEDALEWKIASEMLESWLGVREKTDRARAK